MAAVLTERVKKLRTISESFQTFRLAVIGLLFELLFFTYLPEPSEKTVGHTVMLL